MEKIVTRREMIHNKNTFPMLAKTLPGLETVLADELSKLGALNIKILRRAVSFHGHNELLYRANYHLFTALRILKPIRSFRVRNENELYLNCRRLSWNKYLTTDHSFRVDSVVSSRLFRHSGFVALKVKDAVVDHFRDQTGRRPNVDTREPDIILNIHISERDCTLSLDSSGASLHKRGYRKDNHDAPLNEVFAAGILKLAGWSSDMDLLDPMCGSGTIVIEAGLMSNGIPPGSFRRSFAFQSWLDYESDTFQAVRKMTLVNTSEPHGKIVGCDISGRFLTMAQANAENAGLKGKIEFIKTSFERLKPPLSEGMILINPPYGERMPSSEISTLYRSIGNTLKQHYTGSECWILSSNKEALKHLGLQTSKKMTLFNGPIEVKFQRYLLYQGSKKERKD